MTKTIDAHDARVHFGQMLDEVGETTFVVKRRGRVAAIVLSPEKYADLLETADEKADPSLAKALSESGRQFELGEVGTEEDIMRILREGRDG